MSCPQAQILDSLDTLARAERLRVLAHVDGCAACRAVYLAADPSRLFSLLALEPIPAAPLEALSAAVARQIEGEPRQTSTRRVFALGWAAAAALALLAARALSGPWQPQTTPGAAILAARQPRADVDVLAPEDPRQVVHLSVGDSQVVMIFDERLKL